MQDRNMAPSDDSTGTADPATVPAAGGIEHMSPGRQMLKLALEFGPLVVFFLVNAYYDIFWATGAFMVATVISLVLSRLTFKKIAVMPLVTGVFVLVFGGLTLYLQNDTFIKVKPTIVNLLFASILLTGLAFGHSLLRYLLSDVIHLRPEGWRILTLRWGLFFVALALLNEIVWRSFSTDVWVSFKVFGIMPLTIIFGMTQIGVLTHYAIENTGDSEGDPSAAE